MKRIISLLSLIVVSLISCSPQTENKNLEFETSDSFQYQKGFQLLESTCFSCHSPNGIEQNMVAPNMVKIKKAYLQQYPKKEDFTRAIHYFLSHPTEENALVKNAVSQYGLMPQMSLSKKQVEDIAEYLYQNPIEDPLWYAHIYPKELKRISKNNANISYVDKGFQYAMATKSVLGKQLKRKLKTKGVTQALEFCNINAPLYTDSVSNQHHVSIKRVSDKPRNTNNKANAIEENIIQEFKTLLKDHKDIVPKVQEDLHSATAYYPIITNGMCLQCHGSKRQINALTQHKLNILYPNDKATGYKANELRGIWVVEMKK